MVKEHEYEYGLRKSEIQDQLWQKRQKRNNEMIERARSQQEKYGRMPPGMLKSRDSSPTAMVEVGSPQIKVRSYKNQEQIYMDIPDGNEFKKEKKRIAIIFPEVGRKSLQPAEIYPSISTKTRESDRRK